MNRSQLKFRREQILMLTPKEERPTGKEIIRAPTRTSGLSERDARALRRSTRPSVQQLPPQPIKSYTTWNFIEEE